MRALRSVLAVELAAACFILPAAAQGDAGQCIVAGRLNGGQWAPRFAGVQLLGAHGQVVASADKKLVSATSQVRLARPALLSRCDGNNALSNADNEAPGQKAPAPALSAGVLDVESVAYPKLRTGGELVELRVKVPAERVVMLTK